MLSNLFTPRLDILPPSQKALWNELKEVPRDFTLYGGTAIALYLGHRQSIDFYFFGTMRFNPAQVYSSVSFLKGAEILQQQDSTLTCLVRRSGLVKVSFFGVPNIHRVRPPSVSLDNQLQIASLLDLAGMKAAVVQQRSEAKDYVDLDALIASGISLSEAISAALLIYPESFNPQITLKALSYFGDGDLGTIAEDIRMRLLVAVDGTDLSRLPTLSQKVTP